MKFFEGFFEIERVQLCQNQFKNYIIDQILIGKCKSDENFGEKYHFQPKHVIN